MRGCLLPMILTVALAVGVFAGSGVQADEAVGAGSAKNFELLSKHGNSSCSAAFKQSIPNMSRVARIQGSCCSEMVFSHYSQQIADLKKYADITDIPADPYDIPGGLAAKLLASDDIELTPAEQQAYDYAMANSNEKGPCCCQCWRWHVYGGLAKLMIREHGFTGAQVTDLWNLSDGCGGAT